MALTQCDQIRRNFATLEKIDKYLAIFLRFISFIWHSCEQFGTIYMILRKFSLCKWPNIENTIWPSGHTALTVNAVQVVASSFPPFTHHRHRHRPLLIIDTTFNGHQQAPNSMYQIELVKITQSCFW